MCIYHHVYIHTFMYTSIYIYLLTDIKMYRHTTKYHRLYIHIHRYRYRYIHVRRSIYIYIYVYICRYVSPLERKNRTLAAPQRNYWDFSMKRPNSHFTDITDTD